MATRRSDRRTHSCRQQDDDEALWAAVSETIERLGGPRRVPRFTPPASADHDAARQRDRPEPRAVADRPGSPPPARRGKSAPAPSPAAFEERRARRIASGRIAIDARLDLHGLYQREARARLRAFVLDCYRRGCRHLLVVTGKGVPRREGRGGDDAPDRGVLRRNVPLWLAEPELAAVVVSFTAAHARHGGEGALYVRLRGRDRSAGRPA